MKINKQLSVKSSNNKRIANGNKKEEKTKNKKMKLLGIKYKNHSKDNSSKEEKTYEIKNKK